MKNYTIIIGETDIELLAVFKSSLFEEYSIVFAENSKTLLSALEECEPSLLLIDTSLEGIGGYELLRLLSARPSLENIPKILLSDKRTSESEIKGIELGATDFITKSSAPVLIKKRIDGYINAVEAKENFIGNTRNLELTVRSKDHEIRELRSAIVTTLVGLSEIRDGTYSGHHERLKYYFKELFASLLRNGIYSNELKNADMELIQEASQLYDVGKIAIPDVVLQKPSKLTEAEFECMKKHTTIARNAFLAAIEQSGELEFLRIAADVAGSHHEHYDGKGYPEGLKADEIPLAARMMSLIEVYDALVSTRPYKKGLDPNTATTLIKGAKGSHFDPYLVDAFLDCQDEFELIANDVAAYIETDEQKI